MEDAGATVSDVDKAAVEAAIKELNGCKLGQYLDVSLIKTIGEESQKISRTYWPISITFEIPKELRGDGRTYAVIRVHNGKADVLKLVYFTTGRNGLSEEKKKRLSSGLVEWGKKGGRLRFGVALALIFLILFFYYCIGRKTSEDCRTV